MPVCGRIREFHRDMRDPCVLRARVADFADDLPFSEYIERAFPGIQITGQDHWGKELRISIPSPHRTEDVEALLNILTSSVSILDRAEESHALGLHWYNGVGRTQLGDLVYAAKYEVDDSTRRRSTNVLAELCVEWLAAHPRYRNADCVVAVPPSSVGRGQDLPTILAEVIAGALRIERFEMPSLPRSPQKGLEVSEARRNVQGKFRLSDRLAGRSVILLDDLYDSGSTINEGVRALKAARAGPVFAFTTSKTRDHCDGLYPTKSNWED